MNRATSLYLDIVRFSAAILVFLSHACSQKWTGGFMWQFSLFGIRGVDVFFVLSGYVIAYVTDEREKDARVYAVSRLARIYSVAVPALVLSVALKSIGQTIDPAAYYVSIEDQQSSYLWPFIADLTFVNELWHLDVIAGGNIAYWSLAFEVWYYVVFGLALFIPGWWRRICAGVALSIAGPKIAILFPLWLIGVGCYRVTKTQYVRPRIGVCLFFASLALVAIYWRLLAIRSGHAFDDFNLSPERLADYPIHYATGLLFAANLIGFDAFGSRLLPVLNRAKKQIQWVSGATFSLYLFHAPLIAFLVAITPSAPSSISTRAIVLLGTPVLAFLLAEVTERRKEPWRRLFAWLLRPRLAKANTELSQRSRNSG